MLYVWRHRRRFEDLSSNWIRLLLVQPCRHQGKHQSFLASESDFVIWESSKRSNISSLVPRAPAAPLIITSCGMKTTLPLMDCRRLPTTSATRKAPFHWWYFWWNIISNLYHFCSYARCTRSVSIGKLPSSGNYASKLYCLIQGEQKVGTPWSPY